MVEEIPQNAPSQVKATRLTNEQIQFMDDLGIDFKELVVEGLEKKKKKYDMQTRKQKINRMVINGLFLVIGIMFLWTLNMTANIISIVIVAGIGICFTIIGGLNMYKAMKAEGMIPEFHRTK
jgi:hypothetical protein